MTGIVTSGTGLGAMIMPPVANWLISSYDWRISYRIVGSIVLVFVLLAAQFLRRNPSRIGQLPYGADKVKEEGLNLEVVGFSLREAIHSRQFWILCAMFLSWCFCLQAIMVHIVPHAIDMRISAASAATIMTIIGGLCIGGRLIMGGASDRIGNKLALIIGFIVTVIALSWVIVAKELWMLYLFAIIFGFAYGASIVVLSPMVAGLFGLRAHGVILGAVTFSATIGGAIGPLLTGHIFDITSSYHLAFLVCVALSVVSLILSWQLRPTSKEGGESDS